MIVIVVCTSQTVQCSIVHRGLWNEIHLFYGSRVSLKVN